jgi:aminoglycoside 2''-phosphotransferase
LIYYRAMDIDGCLTHIYDWNPSLAGQPFHADPYGLNNFVIIIGDWVCRFPRTDESRARLHEEARLLAVVRRYVNVAVPDFIADEARPFVAYRLLPGRPLYRHDLLRRPTAAQDRFAAGLAAFLRDLHAIPDRALTNAGLPPAPPPPRSPALWQDRLAAIRAELFPHLWADQHAAIEDLFAPVLDGRLDMTYQPALIHNDLASYHLLVGDNGQLTGVLDFGEAGWGDPAADYAALISGYGESFVARLLQTDPTIAAHLERARFRAAYIELEWALKGIRTGDPSWFLVHLGRARDSRPFGALSLPLFLGES